MLRPCCNQLLIDWAIFDFAVIKIFHFDLNFSAKCPCNSTVYVRQAAKNEKSDASANDGRGTYVQETLKQAKRILQPFFLRRLKADVLQQLPKKTEHTLRVSLTPGQLDLYTDLKTQFMRDVTEKNPLSSGASMMMQLRKAANHELLHRRNYEDSKLKVITKKLLKVSFDGVMLSSLVTRRNSCERLGFELLTALPK